MGNLFTTLRRLPTRTSALIAIVVTAVIIPAALFAWGPSRPTYTIEHPADHVTFNSITNNPNIGDERNFVGAREAGSNDLWKDNIAVTQGKEYTIRMYVHNNAAANLNLVAKDVTARFNLPTTTGKSVQIDGSVSSSNASPAMVYDDTVLTSDKDFNVAYVANSLKFENNSFGAAGTALPESIFDQRGALLGYDKLDGKIPGCFQYAGYVTFKVKPQFAPTNTFEMKKEVRKSGDTTWQKTVATKPGDTVDYQITYNNTGEASQKDVVVKDILPAGITYVAGSTYLKNGSNPTPLKVSDNVTSSTGINIGNYASKAAAYVKFSAKVGANASLPTCGTNKLTNKGQVIVSGGYKEDTADVTVPKTCEEQPCKYSCDSLSVTKVDRTHFTFNTTVTAQNATFKKVTYVIRNAQGAEIDRKESTARTLDYTQATVGKFTVEALVTFSVNGVDKTVTSASCKKPFEVTELPVTPKYMCDSLTVAKIDRTHFTFDTKYTAENATFKNIVYVIRNGSGTEISRSSSASYTQATTGKYTVEALVTFTVKGVDKTVTDTDCKKSFEVTKLPATPVYTCDSITASKISRLETAFTGKATATGGATIESYIFDFGDTKTETVTNPSNVKHTYAEAKEYTAKLTVNVKVNDGTKTITGPNCIVKVTIASEECKPGVPVGDNRCKEECKPGIPVGDERCIDKPSECKPGVPTGDDMCTPCDVPGKENLPKNSKDCVVEEVPPVELPHTGSTENLLTLLGAGSLIAAVGYYVASRRALP